MLEKPEVAFKHRAQPTGGKTKLDEKVARFFTPEIRDMLERVPEASHGNQVSVRVSLGNLRRQQQGTSSSDSRRSFRNWARWNRI